MRVIRPYAAQSGGADIIAGRAESDANQVAFAAEEPAWSLEGRMIIADSCGVDCHCLIGGPPDNGLCQFLLIGQIDNGQYAGVKLDGAFLFWCLGLFEDE